MNEEQLIEFVNWLPSVVPEFKDATPDQIVQALNQMSESDEGQQMLSQLINTFQQAKQSADSQMFKKGGKLAAFINKYGNGGCVSCKKKEILRGGMVNKMTEKMENGGKNRLDTKLNEVLRTEGDKISYRNVPEGVFSQESWKWKNLRRDALGTGRNPVGSFSRVIINSGTPKADTTYTFMPLTDPKDYIDTNADFITVSRKNAEDVAKYSDFLNNFDAIVDKYSTPETMKKGGELATMISTETANNIGLIPKAQWGKKINKKYLNSDDFVGVSSYKDYDNVNPVGQPATLSRNVYKNATLDSYRDATRSNDEDFERLIINPGTEKADTLYQFFPKDIEMNETPFVVVSRSDSEAVAKYKDLLDQFDNTADNYKYMEKKNEFYRKNGGKLATNTSTNTLSNFGLLPKAQNGLSIPPQIKPSGIRGWFWKPTYQPRVDVSGYEGDTKWTGERATYYKPNGDLIQILTKNYKPGNSAITTRTIKHPFTPIADTTTVVSNQYGNREVSTGQFNEVFRRNFDKKSK